MIRSSVPAFSSTISSAMRRSVRSTARASRTVDCLAGMTAEYARTRCLMKADRDGHVRHSIWLAVDLRSPAWRPLEDVRPRDPRLVWLPHPLVATDEKLRVPIERDEESDLAGKSNEKPLLTDCEPAASRENPTADEHRTLEKEIVDW